jgi:hypothetical protein
MEEPDFSEYRLIQEIDDPGMNESVEMQAS